MAALLDGCMAACLVAWVAAWLDGCMVAWPDGRLLEARRPLLVLRLLGIFLPRLLVLVAPADNGSAGWLVGWSWLAGAGWLVGSL